MVIPMVVQMELMSFHFFLSVVHQVYVAINIISVRLRSKTYFNIVSKKAQEFYLPSVWLDYQTCHLFPVKKRVLMKRSICEMTTLFINSKAIIIEYTYG